MKIWIDDERPAPSDDFVVCKDIFEVNELLESLEYSQELIDFISFDYYIDPKNHHFTGSTAIDEIIFHDRCAWPVLSDNFTFATHSSDDECNQGMTEKMNEYLVDKKKRS